MEVMGLPPKRMLDQATRKKMFFGAVCLLFYLIVARDTYLHIECHHISIVTWCCRRRFEREPADRPEFTG